MLPLAQLTAAYIQYELHLIYNINVIFIRIIIIFFTVYRCFLTDIQIHFIRIRSFRTFCLFQYLWLTSSMMQTREMSPPDLAKYSADPRMYALDNIVTYICVYCMYHLQIYFFTIQNETVHIKNSLDDRMIFRSNLFPKCAISNASLHHVSFCF